VFAPHEFRHQKVKADLRPASVSAISFDEICKIGATSKITENPNEPTTPDTIGTNFKIKISFVRKAP